MLCAPLGSLLPGGGSADVGVLPLAGRGGGRGGRGGRDGKPRLSIDAGSKGTGSKVTFD